jgi:hypothetical protein
LLLSSYWGFLLLLVLGLGKEVSDCCVDFDFIFFAVVSSTGLRHDRIFPWSELEKSGLDSCKPCLEEVDGVVVCPSVWLDSSRREDREGVMDSSVFPSNISDRLLVVALRESFWMTSAVKLSNEPLSKVSNVRDLLIRFDEMLSLSPVSLTSLCLSCGVKGSLIDRVDLVRVGFMLLAGFMLVVRLVPG